MSTIQSKDNIAETPLSLEQAQTLALRLASSFFLHDALVELEERDNELTAPERENALSLIITVVESLTTTPIEA